MDLGLKDARVLVVGASGGLGAATARRFSLEGAQVVINSRDHEKLQAAASRISEETGNPVYTHAADVTDVASVEKLVSNAVSMLGGLDILVTNAGGPPGGKFETFDYETWQKASELTVISAVNVVRFALPHLKQSDRASILAIVSVAGKQPVPGLTLSNVMRPAVIGLMKTLADEHAGDGIRCNSILPGWTQTERVDYLLANRAEANDSDPETEAKGIAASIPLGRIGSPEEFANTAVFLSSPAAGFITGVALAVDGGAARSII